MTEPARLLGAVQWGRHPRSGEPVLWFAVTDDPRARNIVFTGLQGDAGSGFSKPLFLFELVGAECRPVVDRERRRRAVTLASYLRREARRRRYGRRKADRLLLPPEADGAVWHAPARCTTRRARREVARVQVPCLWEAATPAERAEYLGTGRLEVGGLPPVQMIDVEDLGVEGGLRAFGGRVRFHPDEYVPPRRRRRRTLVV